MLPPWMARSLSMIHAMINRTILLLTAVQDGRSAYVQPFTCLRVDEPDGERRIPGKIAKYVRGTRLTPRLAAMIYPPSCLPHL